mmetsp:Transcript_13522/g.29671  ORF Transcript_13522/g.29671 Transcript_13522/m.29671 type:complete len:252 (+) Transcript_13522:119-874(+)
MHGYLVYVSQQSDINKQYMSTRSSDTLWSLADRLDERAHVLVACSAHLVARPCVHHPPLAGEYRKVAASGSSHPHQGEALLLQEGRQPHRDLVKVRVQEGLRAAQDGVQPRVGAELSVARGVGVHFCDEELPPGLQDAPRLPQHVPGRGGGHLVQHEGERDHVDGSVCQPGVRHLRVLQCHAMVRAEGLHPGQACGHLRLQVAPHSHHEGRHVQAQYAPSLGEQLGQAARGGARAAAHVHDGAVLGEGEPA